MRQNGRDRMARPVDREGVPVPVQRVEVPQPALRGVICPCCGRGMVPRRTGTRPGRVYASCTLCGGRMVFVGDYVRAI